MAIKLSLGLRQTQNLMMTPQLQQAIKLLTLTHLEMTEVIAQEMTENPLLEEIGTEQSDNSTENIPEVVADDFDPPAAVSKDDFDWKSYLETYNAAGNYEHPNMAKGDHDDFPTHDSVQAKGPNLAEHLLWQLRMETLNPAEWELASNIIHNINDDGYLDIPFDEILASSTLSRENGQGVLQMIWRLDPVGCGTHNLTECLLAQLQFSGNHSALLEIIIQKYLHYVQKHDYQKLAHELGVALTKVEEAVKLIQQLHPRPGRLVASEDTQYVVPDIYVVEVGGKFVVQVNDEGIPRLRISQLYQAILKSTEGSANDSSLAGQDARHYIQEKLKAARWLIKSISNRQKTIYRVAEAIVEEQQEFFRKGVRYLRPMILKDIAQIIEMHESTVSRVTTNKYMHTPVGMFELKFFFNSGFGGKNGGDDLSAEALKVKIKELIAQENPQKPFSDEKIAQLLSQKEVEIARRTVAKYRELLGIPGSSQRKRKG